MAGPSSSQGSGHPEFTWDPTPLSVTGKPWGFLLTPENLDRIQSPRCPIYHSWPGLGHSDLEVGLSYEERKAKFEYNTKRTKEWDVIQSITPATIDFSDLHIKFLFDLRSLLPNSRNRSPKLVCWSSCKEPTHISVWGREAGLQTIITESLIAPTEALLTLLFRDATIRNEGRHDLPRDMVFPDRADFSVIACLNVVAAVMELKPWLNQEACQYMRDFDGALVFPPTSASFQSEYISKEDAQHERNLALAAFFVITQLGRQMLLSNACTGIVYTGADMIIYRRNFDYDLGSLAAIAAHKASPDTVPKPSVGIKLESWTVSFSHPQDPRSADRRPGFIEANPTWALGAVLFDSIRCMQQRPAELHHFERTAKPYFRYGNL